MHLIDFIKHKIRSKSYITILNKPLLDHISKWKDYEDLIYERYKNNESFNDNEYNEGESSFLSRAEEFYRVITGFWPFLQIRELVLFLVPPSKSVSGDPTRRSPLLSLIISVLLVSLPDSRSGNETVLAIKRIQRKDLASCSRHVFPPLFRFAVNSLPFLPPFTKYSKQEISFVWVLVSSRSCHTT